MTANAQGADARRIAYFSMEIALDAALPTYSGGLGVLAGDTLRAAADMALPVCAVSLLYRKGYFRQHLDARGKQSESAVLWNPDELLEPLGATVTVTIEGRPVKVRVYRYRIKGAKGHEVPVYFLDTNAAENSAYDQTLTDHLYGGDDRYRLCQETVLGMGGVAMLEALGLGADLETYHMNEGHAALLTLALAQRLAPGGDVARMPKAAREKARQLAVFTTHTPVAAGHDTFPVALAEAVLGAGTVKILEDWGAVDKDRLNMSLLGVHQSRYVNGVAKRHAEVSRKMFPGVRIEAITNGVHAVSWTADAIRALFDRHLGGWREDNNYLRYAVELPLGELRRAHFEAKQALFAAVRERTGNVFDPAVFTLGFARRAAEYKRADLLFTDPARLRKIADKHPLQIVFAGKAHPKDFGGKALIEKVYAGAQTLKGARVKVVYLENYDLTLGRLITSGVDVWLNNPLKPLEASGTSGMKASINGVPNLSTLDGWWVEGLVEGQTGWEIMDAADAFGAVKDDEKTRAAAAASLYDLLEYKIVPQFYERPDEFAAVMRNAIFVNGPYFNTHRMVLQYFVQAYTRKVEA